MIGFSENVELPTHLTIFDDSKTKPSIFYRFVHFLLRNHCKTLKYRNYYNPQRLKNFSKIYKKHQNVA
ncbi:hypothetical protein LEP1GSC104_4403 [Leptospira interrogans str. UI 12621]|uniref:Uncharacterized protein n=1 Tax=Leptospira interrogans str. UI 12621 TaxID=1049937 RepID=A0A0F6H5C8_LEPIR|nr:hypothetical protein LEP1GSC104_4403 [Leptospira interrogans str. UI 12621]